MAIIWSDGRIINDETGEVAVLYYQPRHFAIDIPGASRRYTFVDRSGVCMSWVQPDDVDAVLSMLGGCCGQKKKGVFRLPQDINGVLRWHETSR